MIGTTLPLNGSVFQINKISPDYAVNNLPGPCISFSVSDVSKPLRVFGRAPLGFIEQMQLHFGRTCSGPAPYTAGLQGGVRKGMTPPWSIIELNSTSFPPFSVGDYLACFSMALPEIDVAACFGVGCMPSDTSDTSSGFGSYTQPSSSVILINSSETSGVFCETNVVLSFH